jgi:hypothetical protein
MLSQTPVRPQSGRAACSADAETGDTDGRLAVFATLQVEIERLKAKLKTGIAASSS